MAVWFSGSRLLSIRNYSRGVRPPKTRASFTPGFLDLAVVVSHESFRHSQSAATVNAHEAHSGDPWRRDRRFYSHLAGAQGSARRLSTCIHEDSWLQTHCGTCRKAILRASSTLDRIRTALELLRQEFGIASGVGKLFRQFRFDH